MLLNSLMFVEHFITKKLLLLPPGYLSGICTDFAVSHVLTAVGLYQASWALNDMQTVLQPYILYNKSTVLYEVIESREQLHIPVPLDKDSFHRNRDQPGP